MRKWFALFALFLALPAFAGTSAVTATITDSDSQTWNSGTFQVTFVPQTGTPASAYNVNGASFTQFFTGSMSSSGVITVTLTDLSTVTPTGGQWRFLLCPNASAACSGVVTNAVVGATPNLSTQLSTGLAGPRFAAGPSSFGYLDAEVSPTPQPGGTYFNTTSNTQRVWNGSAWAAGGGGGGGTAQPAFLITASPYGAKCDGSTDDTTAIQSALTAAATAHGTVIFPQGICDISSALTIPAGTTNMGIQGQIGFGSFVQQTTASADILDVNGTVGSTVGNLTIAHMFFVRGVAYTGTPKGLSFSYCLNCIAYYVQVADSFTNWFTTNGANNTWTYITSIGNRSTPSTGVLVSGNTSSLYIDSVNISGAHTTGMSFTGAANDSFITHLNTVAGVTTGLSISLAASDLHFINPIMDACGTNCININNSNGGSLGNSNNIEIIGCWCNSSTGASSTPVVINNSEGVHLLGGTYVERAGATVNAIYLNGGSLRNSVVGVHLISSSSVSTSNGIVIGPSSKDNIVSDNTVMAPTAGSAWNAAIYVSNAGSGNTVTGNTVSGFASIGVATDISSTLNVYSGNTVDTTNITTPFYDGTSGNTISASTIAVGVVGNAQDYKSTAAITGPVPVKWDTSNANQVVATTTTDTGAGIPIGVCVNSPVLGNSCLVMTTGTVALTLGTGTCSIGNFVIVDTTTNGRVKCTGTYSAGTVIGTAQAANSTVGTAFNVALGLR